MKNSREKKLRRKLCAMGMPLVLVFLLIYILPIGMTAWYSLLENSFSRAFVGLENYATIWQNAYFLMALRNTVTLTVLLVGFGMLATVLLAYLLKRHVRVAMVGAAVLLLPLLIPSTAVATIWQILFNTSAFSSNMRARTAIVSLFVWKYTGVSAVFLNAALARIPSEIHDASALDGAGPIRTYLQISLPVLRQEVTLVLLFLLMFAFRIYKESYLLFGEYPSEKMYLIQHYLNNHFLKMNFQYVASGAASFALLAMLAYGAVYCLLRRKGGRP